MSFFVGSLSLCFYALLRFSILWPYFGRVSLAMCKQIHFIQENDSLLQRIQWLTQKAYTVNCISLRLNSYFLLMLQVIIYFVTSSLYFIIVLITYKIFWDTAHYDLFSGRLLQSIPLYPQFISREILSVYYTRDRSYTTCECQNAVSRGLSQFRCTEL